VALVAAPGASVAASKRSEYSDKTKCLGGGCTAQNPDRARDPFQSSYYKKNKKKRSTRSTTNY
jgi:hypothetical protein